ncbi:MAG: hypothetical protein B7Y88_08855 [Sphingomonadales bacterium 32-64-17]|nr:MAG: hypothetical protein B7Y88_08855 [Sphingomonadales bacterium 32-64-17]
MLEVHCPGGKPWQRIIKFPVCCRDRCNFAAAERTSECVKASEGEHAGKVFCIKADQISSSVVLAFVLRRGKYLRQFVWRKLSSRLHELAKGHGQGSSSARD